MNKIFKPFIQQSLVKQFEQSALENDKQKMVGLIELVVFLTCLVGGSVMFFYDMNSYLSLFLMGIISLIGWLLNRAGHPTASAMTLIIALLAAIQFNVFTGFGIHDVAIIAWPAFIFFAGLLFGWRAIPYTTALVMLLAVVTYFVPNAQFFSNYSDTGDLIVMLLILTAFSIIGMSILSINENSISAMRESAARYRHLYENNTVGLYRTTPDGRVLLANPALVEMLGFSSFDELASRNLDKEGFGSVYDRVHFLEVIEKDGQVKGLEGAWLRRDGTTIFIRESASATRDGQGKTLYYDGIIEDVTAHRLAENARNVAEANYRAIFENATVGVFQSTPAGRLHNVNPAMARIYGYDSPEEMLAGITSISSQIYVNPTSRQDLQRQLAEQGEVHDFIGEHYRKDGSIIWTVTTARAVKDKAGQISYYEGFIIDNTERVRTEVALKESQELLSLFIRNSPIFTYIKEVTPLESRVLQASNNFSQMIGQKGLDIIGKTMDELFEPEFAARITADDWDVVSRGEVLRLEEALNGRYYNTIKFPLVQDGKILLAGYTIDITERKHAEEELKNSEKRFYALIKNGRDNISLLTEEGNLLWESPSINSTLGYATGQYLGRSIFELMHPEDQAWTRSMFNEVVQLPGNLQEGTFRLLHADGAWRWIECSAANLLNEPGVQAVVINYHDVTDRKMAELALAETQATTSAIVDSTSDMIWSVDSEAFGLLTFNHGLSDYFLQHRAMHIQVGMRPEDLFPPGEFVDRWREFYRRAIHQGMYTVEYSPFVGSMTQQLTFNLLKRDGKIFGISVFGKDITERKQAETALRTSEARYRFITENTADVIWSLSLTTGKFTYVSPSVQKLRGYTPEEVMTQSMTDALTPESAAYVEQVLQQRLAAFQAGDMNIRMVANEVDQIRKDGTVVPTEVVTTLVTDSQNRPIEIIGVSRDITERRQAEKALRESEKKYRELFQENKDGIAIFLLNPHGPPGTFIELNNAAPQMLGYSREEMLEMTPMMLEPQLTQEQLQARESEFKSKGVVNFETVLMHKNGHSVFTEFSAQVILFEDRPAIMNIVRDITERKQHENELQAITSLSAALRSAPTRAEMLPLIVKQLSTLLGCDAISAEIMDSLTSGTRVEAAYGNWASLIGFHQPPGTGLNAIIQQTRQSYHNNHITGEPGIGIPAHFMQGILAVAGMPLIAQDQLIGFLWVGRKSEIDPSEVRLLAAVADIAANAVHRATLHERSQKIAVDLMHAYETTLEGWAHALELRDQETEGHARRVVQMTVDLARAFGFGEDELVHVRRGSLLHDIGKMGIPDSVLLKPGTLNEREWEIMRQHPEYAYHLLQPIVYLRPALDIPYCHHEKWDGSGYPRGLKGEEIPFVARLFAIVDVWDALRSDRPYRKAWAAEKTRQYLVEQSGRHFDPRVVGVFLSLLQSIEPD